MLFLGSQRIGAPQMKAVILAGGYGTRISEESTLRPKPMVEIGGKPILWHIMKHYSGHGIQEFVLCCGYKGYMIKEYFANYLLHMSDVTIDLSTSDMTVHHKRAEPWKVTMVDTGADAMTGGRLAAVKDYVGNDDFCFTYGDGVSDVDITALVKYHKGHGKQGTVTTVQPPGRFGIVSFDGDRISGFEEKPHGSDGWINGGFFVLKPSVFSLLNGPQTVWEREPLEAMAKKGELMAYRHDGFWMSMDTLRDKNALEALWEKGDAPWKTWKD